MNNNNFNLIPFNQRDLSNIKYIYELENLCNDNLKDINLEFTLKIKSIFILKNLYDYRLLTKIDDIKNLVKLVQTVSILYEYKSYNELNKVADDAIENDQNMIKFLNNNWNKDDIQLIYMIIENVSFKLEQKLRKFSEQLNIPYNFDNQLGIIGSIARDIVSDASKLELIGLYGINKLKKRIKYNTPNFDENDINQELLRYFNGELKDLYNISYYKTIPGKLLFGYKRAEMKQYFHSKNIMISV